MSKRKPNIKTIGAGRMDIIKKLELYRLENRITQQDLAKELEVAFSTVSRWFNGKTMPSKIQQYHVEKYLTERVGRSKKAGV
jgi:transcriptional regulator with XRE-family HTH domain